MKSELIGRPIASYGVGDDDSERTRREHEEKDCPRRAPFARDRDRILHSKAFRRLEYKTQVFVYHEGDHYRTRLTHTLEVSQISRSIARALGLNEDLVEAIALAHDLGHPPFGHLGESVLDELMVDHGGFEHNRQSARLIERIENVYEDFHGLNLTFATREAIHYKAKVKAARKSGADRAAIGPPTLEAQIVDLSDQIAYNAHDVDDGVTSGLLDATSLARKAPIWGERYLSALAGGKPGKAADSARRALISTLINDLIDTSAARLEAGQIDHPDKVQARKGYLASFSPEISARLDELKNLLQKELYSHHRALRMDLKAKRLIERLFKAYASEPKLMPPNVYANHDKEDIHRLIADYIAGMTDKFAIEENNRLFDPNTKV